MIPTTDVEPTIPSPLPECDMPNAEDISEEGFGWFRSTWFIGRVPIAEATAVVREEGEIIDWLDRTAHTPEEFELLATAIERCEVAQVPEPLRQRSLGAGISAFIGESDDSAPLESLEIGVAGLAHTLSAVGCLTAASCRSHETERSWSDCPVVFFASPAWRLAILADLVGDAGCGLDADRGMLKIYGRSVRDTNRLADLLIRERRQFGRRPDARPKRAPASRVPSRSEGCQLQLGVEAESAS